MSDQSFKSKSLRHVWFMWIKGRIKVTENELDLKLTKFLYWILQTHEPRTVLAYLYIVLKKWDLPVLKHTPSSNNIQSHMMETATPTLKFSWFE
jgi:hypothetical protein